MLIDADRLTDEHDTLLHSLPANDYRYCFSYYVSKVKDTADRRLRVVTGHGSVIVAEWSDRVSHSTTPMAFDS